MIVVSAMITIAEGKGDEYAAHFAKLAPLVRKDPGCLTYVLHRKIGSPVDQLLLACFHYDPKSGKYSLAIMRLVQTAGILTVVAIGLTILMLRRRDRRDPLSHGANA